MRQRRSLRPLLAATVILAAPALTVRAQQFREADRSALPLECGEVMGFYVTDLDGDAIPDVVFDMTRQLLAPYPARLGRGYRLEAHGSPAGAGIWISGQGANTPLPPFGTLGLGPGAAPLALLPPPTTGAVAALDVVLPATPALAGLDVFVQAIDVATLRLSNTLHEQMVAW